MKSKKKLYSLLLVSIVLILFLILISSTVSAADAEQSSSSTSPYAYITNINSNTVSVIDTSSNTITTTISVGNGPQGIAITSDGTIVYVTNAGNGIYRDSTVSVIDTASNTVTTTVGVGSQPTRVAITPDGSKAYVTDSGDYTVSIIDTSTNTVIDTVFVGIFPQGVAVTPDGSKAYVASDNTVYVIDNQTNTIKFKIDVEVGPKEIVVNPEGTKVYVTHPGKNIISVIDTSTNTVIDTISIVNSAYGIAINPEGTKLYVTHRSSDTASIINLVTNSIKTMNVGNSPEQVAVSPDRTRVYVTNSHSNTVSIIDSATDTVIDTVSVGDYPYGIVVTPLIEPILPVANFNCNITDGYFPLSIQFTDLSENATELNWDFGDGTTSTDQNPIHTYITAGTYNVNLTVTNMNGTDSKTATINVLKSTPAVTWSNPADTTYGTPLDSTQLNSTASVTGAFVYTPPAGTILNVGTHILHVDFTPTDTANYINASKDVTINVLIPPPNINSITVPLNPVPVSTSITANASVTYLGDLSTLTGEWNWGDGSTLQSQESSDFEFSHTYNSAGIYTVTFKVTDADGRSDTQQAPNYVVVYDPQGGFVTGGGWINSPAGAYMPDNTLAGKATFGFVSKYQKGATTPIGTTEFKFDIANLDFHSENYEWLVVAGSQAKYKGTGTINEEGNYGFMLGAVDGSIKGDGIDRFRIKIWDKLTNEIVYDNEIGTGEDAEPSTAIGGGSIIIHNKK